MTNALTTTTQGPDPLALIAASGRADSTKTQYTRALAPFVENGGNLADARALQEYAGTLSNSRRAHLRSAVALWSKETAKRIKAAVTPENVDQAQAALMRLEALPEAITVTGSKGTKSHTWLSGKQVKELMATCGAGIVGWRDRVVLALLVGAGLRRSEAAGLTWDAVRYQPIGDRMRTVLEIHGKGAKDRVVPISDKLASILDQWSTWTGGKEGRILRSLGMAQEIGDDLSAVQIFRIVRAHGEQIGVPTLAPHDCRRTFAQLGYDAGIDIAQLSTLLGHASIKTTQRYLNLDVDLDVTASDFVPL
ncbi:tyrosine-type recombinase/integrase [candidate division KSB1 bacterium]|nr:tyrosine-type recombinase/integrase [candidate division KSB1 bacterium]